MSPLLYELHDLARERGVEGYRQDVEGGAGGGARGWRSRRGRRRSSVEVRGALGVLVLTSANGENSLSLETLEALADEVERLAADEDVRMVAITGSGPRIFSSGADLNAVRGIGGAEVTSRGTAACDRIAALACRRWRC